MNELNCQVPWASFIVSLIVLLISREAQTAQAQNYMVTVNNRDLFSLPFVKKEHVPAVALVLWAVGMGFVLLAIEVFVVR